MKNKAEGGHACNPAEIRFLERLRQRPELRARFESILELTGNAEGPVKTADAVEELLIQELRQLGHTSMNQWATQAEQRVSDELKAQDATVRSRKKRR
jgi:phosphoribosyl-dephospho-CoA transferase